MWTICVLWLGEAFYLHGWLICFDARLTLLSAFRVVAWRSTSLPPQFEVQCSRCL